MLGGSWLPRRTCWKRVGRMASGQPDQVLPRDWRSATGTVTPGAGAVVWAASGAARMAASRARVVVLMVRSFLSWLMARKATGGGDRDAARRDFSPPRRPGCAPAG